MFNNFFSENRAFYEIMWKNIVEWGRPQMAVWRMYIACWIPKATNTHSEYVILIACDFNIGYTKHLNVTLQVHGLSFFSGPHFRHMGLQERQEALRSQYFFICTCRPCSLSGQQDFQVILNALYVKACRMHKVKVAF
jgi:hypothetical protein